MENMSYISFSSQAHHFSAFSLSIPYRYRRLVSLKVSVDNSSAELFTAEASTG